IIAHLEIGEILMRAFILRRVAMLSADSAGTIVLGRAGDRDVMRLQNLFTSNGYPHTLLDPGVDEGAVGIAARFGVQEHDLPIVISGHALMSRSFNQATKFGAEIGMQVAVVGLRCDRRNLDEAAELDLSTGETVRCRTVVIASGARYRKPEIPRFKDFEGRG